MQVRTFSALCIVMAVLLIFAVAAEVFIDDYIEPRSMFAYLVLGTLITGTASLMVDIDVPL